MHPGLFLFALNFTKYFYSPYYEIALNRRMTEAELNLEAFEFGHMQPHFSNKLEDLTALDWRDYGVVSPVRDQRDCGSCWAFSAVGAIEGELALHGKNVTLSPQQMVDCLPAGCYGGPMTAAFEYAMHHDLSPWDEYPYMARPAQCREVGLQALRISGYKNLSRFDEALLKKALQKRPISVGIVSRRATFQFYKSGVYGDPACHSYIDHAVLLVGYGTDPVAGDYWIIKNSWGDDWGENGYMRIQRNYGGEGMCGITLMASYPIY